LKARGVTDRIPNLHDLPDDDRPRERLHKFGAAALTNTELIALLLGTGTNGENVLRLAERILARLGGIEGLLRVSVGDLQKIKGVGNSKRAQLIAAAELARRMSALPAPERAAIHQASDAARLVADMAHLDQEQVRLLLLDAGKRVIAQPTLYIGTASTAVARVAEVYREAVQRGAAALILAHNHPSGNPHPSPEDIELTRALVAAGELLDIQFLDHLIIGRDGWRSLRELGLLPSN
jgi:DNA repair protein RadC